MHDIKVEQAGVREVDIQRLLRLLWKRIGVIIAATVIAGMISALVSTFFIDATYRTGFKAYINNKEITEETITCHFSRLRQSHYVK